ncbi:uncharacterized protein DUF3710 [Asanoa ferruginea]|uniref:Uncharacterized protein DUF3710 n=1 Tax=Asanoa ferruginea TaxID=53367 RepID=A0A3D9ZN50_9ACTN|nr:uncharacterized protein DUF3710 [Asanoa ferruginea]GIF49663.1 hypothetical protein Afe04nite_42020 [Asanoa ferruginea]
MFSRGGSGRHARGDRGDRSERPARGKAQVPPPARSDGPYDISAAPSGVERLDLGSLQIPVLPDIEIRVQANPDGAVQQVVLVNGDNALQIGVFAAPRSEGIWQDVRDEIRKSLFSEGVAAEETEGEYGVELRARVRTADGLTDLRFLGIDGPRWMVRGVFQGPAATDPSRAGVLVECLHGIVVDRGQEAKPVREPLPLRLPKDASEQVQQQQAEAAAPPVAPPTNGSGSGPGAGPSPRRRPSPRPR